MGRRHQNANQHEQGMEKVSLRPDDATQTRAETRSNGSKPDRVARGNEPMGRVVMEWSAPGEAKD